MDTERSDSSDFLGFVQLAAKKSTEALGSSGSQQVELTLLLRRLGREVLDEKETELPSGLTWACFRVGFALWVAGDMEPHRIAEIAAMSRAAVSASRKLMEDRGLVTTIPSQSDQRSKVLSLTSDGTNFVLETHTRSLDASSHRLERLSVHERHLLAGLAGKMIDPN